MKMQINSGHNVDSRDSVADYVRGVVADAVAHFKDQITRVEVHLADANGVKFGMDDKRCMIEARVAKLEPIAVTHHGGSLDEAINGAAGKLKRSLEHALQKQHEHR